MNAEEYNQQVDRRCRAIGVPTPAEQMQALKKASGDAAMTQKTNVRHPLNVLRNLKEAVEHQAFWENGARAIEDAGATARVALQAAIAAEQHFRAELEQSVAALKAAAFGKGKEGAK